MDRDQTQRVKAIIDKVRVFRRFTIQEAQRLIKLCQYKTFGVNEMVYRVGDPSDEMLILLQGKLSVLNEEGTPLGEIQPGTTTGEMGVLTRQPRSATILATEQSAGFVINRRDLNSFLRDDTVRLKVYENLVELFCERLSSANVQIETYAKRSREG